MARPTPAQILQSTATVKVCTGTDRYQNQTTADYTVERVHIQPTNEVKKTPDNTDCTLRAILFVDVRISKPRLDWGALFRQAHANKGDMRVVVNNVEYTAMLVDELHDEHDRLHHWEISLV